MAEEPDGGRRRWIAVVGVVVLVLAGGLGGRALFTQLAGDEMTCPPAPEPGRKDNYLWHPPNFVRLDGGTYEIVGTTSRQSASRLGSLTLDNLGDQVGVVCHSLIRLHSFRQGFEPRSGDASFLPVETELRAVDGYAPWFRIGAEVDGELYVYGVTKRESARAGADLYDIGGRVDRIVFHRGGRMVVKEPETVCAIVDAILAAPLYPPDEQPKLRGPDVALYLHLEDGSVMWRGYYPAEDVVTPRLIAPPVLKAAYERVRTQQG